MARLDVCSSCGGFVPSLASTCPHCQRSTRPLFERLRVGALGGVFGGGAIAFTLMACYGMPPCDGDECNEPDLEETDASPGRDTRRPNVQVGEAGADAGASDAAPEGDGGDATDGGDAADGGDAG